MANTILTLSQLEDLYKTEKFKHVRLVGPDNKNVVPWNTAGKPSSPRFQEIKKALGSNLNPEGFYLFEGAPTLTKQAPKYGYMVKKGNPKKVETPAPLKEDTAPVTSYDSVLKIQKELAELKARNEYLEQEAGRLDGDNKDLEANNAEMTEQMSGLEESAKRITENSNSVGNWFGEMKPFITEFLDLEKRKLTLKEGGRPGGAAPVPGSQQYGPYFHKVFTEGSDEMLTAELTRIQQFSPQLFQQIVQHYQINFDEQQQPTENGTEQVQDNNRNA